MKFLDLKKIIPSKYLIPEELLQEYRDFINTNMPPKKTGRPRVDSDPLIAGLFYLLKTGCQWDALPLCFGSSKTVFHRFKQLVKLGIFQKIWKAALIRYDREVGLCLRDQSIDSCQKKSPLGGEKTGPSPVDRRKLGTKLNLVVEANGIPIGATIARANHHDTQLLTNVLNDLQNQIPQSNNHYFHTDKGFVSRKNHREIISRNFTPVMPSKKPRNKPYDKRPIKDLKRWVIERTFSWICRFRRVLIRYEKLADNFLALIQFAFQIIVFRKI